MLSIGYKLASNEKILKALVWSLSNICRIKPIPHFSQVEGCVVFFA